MSLAAAERQRERLNAYQTTRNTVDPVALFERAWGVADDWQRETLTSPSKRLLLNCARQSGKSTVTSTIGAHELMTLPGALVLILSPTLRQSGELFQKLLHVYHSWPDAPRPLWQNKLSIGLPNGARALSLPGTPDTIRGFSAVTTLIIDEAAFTADALYRGVRPMLAVSNGRLALLSSPMGKRGYFYEECAERRHNWHYLEVPASINPRISEEFLAEERAALGPLYAQEYECQFLNSETAMFDYDAVQRAIDEGRIEEAWF